jgi:hypothetical protein
VVDVGHAVDDADDLSLERRRLERAGVREDPVAHLLRQVQRLGDAQRVLVVMKAPSRVILQGAVERLLAGMAERWMPHVVPQSDRLDEVFVQTQRPRDSTGDGRGLERVRHACSVVVAGRIDEHLGLALEAPERLRMQDAVAVTLERRAQQALLLFVLAQPSSRLVRAHGKRREPALLVLANVLFEGVCDSSGHFRHAGPDYCRTRL